MEKVLYGVIIVSLLLVINAVFQLVRVAQKVRQIDNHKWNKSNQDHSKSRATIIYVDDNGNKTCTRPTDGRCLDGIPLQTDDDWVQWYVWKGYADDGLASRLYELETKMIATDTDDPESLLREWHWYYDRYRRICSRHGMWNRLIDDRAPFIPTKEQIYLEQRLFFSLEQKVKNAKQYQAKYAEYSQLLLRYLLVQPRHIGDREKALSELSNGRKERKSDLRKVYRNMVRNHSLIEKKDKNDRWIFRKPPSQKEKRYVFDSKPSVYSSQLYQNVTSRTEYKAVITVGYPVEMDKELRHCKFLSKSREAVYYTTLESCTCPMFSPNSEPCKHMVKLADALGFYTIKVRALVEQDPPFIKKVTKPDEISPVRIVSQETKINNPVRTEEKEEKENSMIASRTKLLYRELIRHFDEEGIEYVDKTTNGGSLYFFSEAEAENLRKKDYPVFFTENGTKGTGHRPAWYIKL